jgi:hypothetical protein
MTIIESDIMSIEKSAEALYAQLLDFESFGKMMPDNVQKFESDNNSFLFQLKGAPEVRLVVDETVEPSLISFKSASSKLDFTLACNIEAIDANSCKAGFMFNGKFNMMMKMMVEKPLTNFIEKLADKLTEI